MAEKHTGDYGSPAFSARTDARKRGAADRAAKRPCDPAKYGALPHSAWAKWYADGYNKGA